MFSDFKLKEGETFTAYVHVTDRHTLTHWLDLLLMSSVCGYGIEPDWLHSQTDGSSHSSRIFFSHPSASSSEKQRVTVCCRYQSSRRFTLRAPFQSLSIGEDRQTQTWLHDGPWSVLMVVTIISEKVKPWIFFCTKQDVNVKRFTQIYLISFILCSRSVMLFATSF